MNGTDNIIELPPGLFDIIYADPPWNYRGRKQFGFKGDVGVDSGGAVNHYKTMKVEELCGMGDAVKRISPSSCLLFMWTTGPMIPDTMKVIDAWGFTYATDAFVWDKQRTNPGYYTLSQCEFCFAAKRGKIPYPRGSRKERQFMSQCRGKHSEKPDEVRKRIEKMFPKLRKIELFATKYSPGWTCWGDQLPKV